VIDIDSLKLLLAIGTCHRMLLDFGQKMSGDASVISVAYWMNAYNSENMEFRLEDSVDVELSNGTGRSWQLDVVITRDKCTVLAEVRENHERGQDLLALVADKTYASAAECALGILEIGNELVSSQTISRA
jgi:hypothetical protein